MREHLLQIYRAALVAANGRTCVGDYLRRHPRAGPQAVLAVGKAAWHMAAGAFDASRVSRTLIVTKYGHTFPELLPADAESTALESGHPLPDAASLEAGRRALDFLHGLPPGEPLLMLLSGGASALLERLAPGVTLADLERANAWLLGSGLDIHAVNAVRKSLSALKGGRLAAHVQGREVRMLMISDVPGDDPRSIGSGPFILHHESALPANLPAWLRQLTQRALPLPASGAFARIRREIVASSDLALRAARQKAEALGYQAHLHEVQLHGDALEKGRDLARYLKFERPGHIHLWGGETVVRLPPASGRGGRCQSLALAAAMELTGTRGIRLLAAGSDGSDGPGADAGALVDGATVARGEAAGRDALRDLTCADAGSFLAASGDLLRTGPTGTNVMDICVGYTA